MSIGRIMDSGMGGPALFFDFDNTVTVGDVLDRVIERYSVSDAWREWEAEWQAGRMSTPECLRRQVGDLNVSPEELRRLMLEVDIDPAFPRIAAWAAARGAALSVLSDNFSLLVHAILDRKGLSAVAVFANELVWAAGRLEARFPYLDPACPRCAHCKAQHLRAARGRPRIYVGDGLSDVCPSLVADVVFAKDSLAADLARRGVPFLPFHTLDDVLRYLELHHGAALPV
jgi:2-hydroxy-3-keto-5-methylthiopentenyl-1-phosphate phosphatase